jgi:AraC-like DNA-binding protein/ligand-binding sensor protein
MKTLDSSVPAADAALEQRIIEQIHHSELYRNYEQAFVETTGLSLRLATGDGRLMEDCEHRHENPFCQLLARKNKACEACLLTWRKITLFGESEPHTSTCFAGLIETCLPIRTGGRTIGYFLTGEITTTRPTEAKFAGILARLREDDVEFEEARLRQAYFSTRIMSRKHYASILDLLRTFAGHLALIAGQLLLHGGNSEAPEITRAREFIRLHLSEPLDLKQVADSANLSSCYFCRKFKESAGMTFTSYVARTRVEAAKTLLANPQVRVSEIAFEVGFQSLTHFNRVFKQVTALSPTRYRDQLFAESPAVAGHGPSAG